VTREDELRALRRAVEQAEAKKSASQDAEPAAPSVPEALARLALPRLDHVSRPLIEPLPDPEPIGPIEVVEVSKRRDATKRRRKRSAGAKEKLYPRAEVRRVIVMWRDREHVPQQVSKSSLARRGFSRKAVQRVIRLDEGGAFRLGPRGGLQLIGMDGGFRSAPDMISLRKLERALGLDSLG
jgi:hypothetical protein